MAIRSKILHIMSHLDPIAAVKQVFPNFHIHHHEFGKENAHAHPWINVKMHDLTEHELVEHYQAAKSSETIE